MRSLRVRVDKLANIKSQAPEVVIHQAGGSSKVSSNSKSGIVIYLPDNHREEPTKKYGHRLCLDVTNGT